MRKKILAFFGGYGDQYWLDIAQPTFAGTGNSVTTFAFDAEDGGFTPLHTSEQVGSPSMLALSANGQFLYAANEMKDFRGIGKGGGLTAFSVDADTGALTVINQSFSYGAFPSYVCLDKKGEYLFAACHGSYYCVSRFVEGENGLVPEPVYDEGCVCVFRINSDGGIGALTDRLILQGTGADPVMHASAHPHSVLINEEDLVIVPNKGGDNIYVGRFNRETEKIETLSVFEGEHGSSPRHAAFVPKSDLVLIQDEYDGKLWSYRLSSAAGTLEAVSFVDTENRSLHVESAMNLSFPHPWGIDVQLHPNGRFVYCDNDQQQVVLSYLDAESGTLRLQGFYPFATEGGMCRGIQIDPTGRFLIVTLVRDSEAICFSIDQESGALTERGRISVPTPTSLKFAVYP